jgi:hypothetical protein
VHPETLEYDGKKLREAAESLEQMLKVNQIDAAYTKYLFGLYWKMAEPHLQEMPGHDLTGFLNSGVAACNHTGDVVLGQKLAALLTEKRKSIGIEEYLDLNNRAAVFVADGYEYVRATEMLEKNVAALRRVRDGYVAAGSEFGMSSEDNVRSILLARALSALATYKAIAYPETPKEKIYALYDEAIREFGGGFNIKITQSRRMHYEMMISDRESFEDTCASYFDIGDSAEPVMMEDEVRHAAGAQMDGAVRGALNGLVQGEDESRQDGDAADHAEDHALCHDDAQIHSQGEGHEAQGDKSGDGGQRGTGDGHDCGGHRLRHGLLPV